MDTYLTAESYVTLLRSLPIPAILTTQSEGRVVDVSDALLAQFGFARDEMIGRTTDELGVFTATDQREKVIQAYQKEGRWEIEAELRLKSGVIEPFIMSIRGLEVEGRPHFLTTLQQISSQRQLQNALDETAVKYQAVLDSSRDAIGLARAGSFEYVNPAHLRLFGHSSFDELRGRSVLDLIVPSERAKMLERFRLRTAGKETPTFYETRGLRKDGSEFDMEMQASTFTLHGEMYTMGVMRDITERNLAEQAIRERKALVQGFLEHSRDAIMVTDEEGVVAEWSPATAGLTGYSREESIGQYLWDVQVRAVPEEERSPERAENIKKLLQGALTTGSGYFLNRPTEAEIQRPDGSRVNIQSVAFAIPTDRGVRLGGILRDMTERKQVEERLQRQLRRVHSLREIDHAISSSVGLEISLGTILTHALAELPVDAACILMLDQEMQTLAYAAGSGFRTALFRRGMSFGLNRSYAGRAVLERRRLEVPEVTAEGTNPDFEAALREERFVSYYAMPLVSKGVVQGVIETFHRTRLVPDDDWLALLDALAEQAALAIDNATMFERLEASNRELAVAYEATIEGWSQAMDLRDKETEGHTRRVTGVTLQLARAYGVSSAILPDIRRGALLHDVGKLGVPDSILLKPGPLTDEEWVLMRQHPEHAYALLSPIHYLRSSISIPYCHHEKWDGSGYPRGLKGEQIPLEARLFAVVDVWDALTSDRPYRPAWEKEKALQHIAAQAGSHFDPHVVAVFMDLARSGELISTKSSG